MRHYAGATSVTWKYATAHDPSVTTTTVPGPMRCNPWFSTTSHVAVAAERQAAWSPRLPADTASEDEAAQATEVARQLIAAAKALLAQLSFFAQQ